MIGDVLPWAALLVLLGLWMLGAYNRITALRAAVLAAWGPVDQLMGQRGKALAHLLVALTEPLAAEAAALDAVAQAQVQVQITLDAARRLPVAPDTIADLSKADAVLAAVSARVLALVEQQPLLRASAPVAQALATISAAPAQLAFARRVFNQAGENYNLATRQFPTRLLGAVLRFAEAGRL